MNGGLKMVMSGSQKNIEGMRFIKKEDYAICLIDNFSSELKELIRKHLSKVCYGSAKTSLGRISYNYKNTIKEFLKRYEPKMYETRIGMVGELMTHVLILELFPEFETVSPYFNNEDRSIKKGFDAVLSSNNNKELWITEVKSGKLQINTNSNESNRRLLGLAKRDLKTRLNEPDIGIWENAINGAKIALEHNVGSKKAVVDILLDETDNIYSENTTKSSDKNVVLVSSLFTSLVDEIREESLKEFYSNTVSESLFNKVLIFSIQKELFEAIHEFLKEEAEK